LETFWCPDQLIDVDGSVKEFPLPKNRKGKLVYHHSTGLSYQAEEARRCISLGLLESPTVNHEESLLIARIEDELRRQIGVKYPKDD
jgi:dihydrodiol dehydrogenase / D-xylose 1-dehydrogenase (NADP)